MVYNLKIYTKSSNIKSFFIFLTVLYKVLDKLSVIKKLVNKCNHLAVFSILKSPHINKTAQQHFGLRSYNKTIQAIVIDFIMFISWIKILKNQLFMDVSLSILYIVNTRFILASKLAVHFNKKLSLCLNFFNITVIKILLGS